MSDPTSTGSTGMDVAVIGMACRFPGAQNVEQYWQNLIGGVESITRYTPQELEAIGESPSLTAQPGYVPVARAVDGIDLFDAAFFGFNPREAEVLDPQQRLFLECVWEALEHAGCDTETFPGLVGVFAGTRMSGYLLNIYGNMQVLATVGDFNAQLANDKDYIATRVSYKLNLGGPSITVQTACSTSLVALHLACQALLAGDCDLAIAGASSVRVPQGGFVFRDGDVGSPDGRVRAFDAGAQGTIFGSGLGAVVLKRLEDAQADGDQIWAVVKGSAVTNDGSLKVGYTAPGADGQARVIRAAQITAGVEPDTIGYVEAHGTGTPVGDPIEVSALTRAFRERTGRTGFCALGSVKPNIGHASAAAGVAGLIKTALALKRRLIPPSILFERPNPEIDFAGSPFFVNTALREWQGDAPLRAGVSAFGIGGTNAHVILEEAPEPAPGDEPSRPLQLLVVSARTSTALETAAANLARCLEEDGDDAPEHLADVAWTLQTGRRALEHRRAVVAGSRAAAAAALADPRLAVTGSAASRTPAAAFLFSGQGAQYAGMAAGIYEAEPVFRAVVDRAAARLAPRLGLDLRELLFPAGGRQEEAGRRLAETALTQPALFVVELALARLWMSWGIAPQAMIGHSIGEYVAACLAGVFSEEEGLELVAARGRLMGGLPAGAMLAVSLPEAEVQAAFGDLAGQLALAAVNSPGRSVVAGPEEAVAALEERLQRDGVSCRRLHTSHAFHSQMMEPILPAFLEEVSRVDLRPPQLPYVSNLTGTWITAAEATDPGYWVRHLRGTVRFAEGLATLFGGPAGGGGLAALLEVGPGKALATFARQHPARPASLAVVTSLRHPQDAPPDLPRLLGALGQLWTLGVAVDWAAFHGGESRRKVTLPSYPFERRRFWVDAQPGQSVFGGASAPRRNADIADWFYVPGWRPALPPPPAIAGGALQRWLLLADRLGLAERLAERLAAAGGEVVLVEEGEGFARPQERGDGRYQVAAGRREDFAALLDDLRQRGFQPDAVIHAWGVTGEPGGPLPADRLAPSQERGFWSLIALAQALGRAGAKPVRLAVVADRLFRVLPGDRPCPEKATALGPVRVLPQEMPQVACTAVDVAWPAAPESERGEIVEQVLAELAAPVLDPAVAWRGGDRWLLGYQPSRLEGSALPLRLRHEGVYLITGGLGGFGLTFADFLAREQKARLVLVGRSGLPPREQWESLVAEHADGAADPRGREASDPRGREAADPMIDRIARLLALEEAGGEVLVVSADVTDEAAMRGVVAAARQRFGGLHGVIHAAGVPGGGLLQLKTREAAERVLAPKVQGLRALDAALGDAELDFLVLCSSTIAVLGSFGQVDYCAANNYLDAWAQAAAARPAGPGGRGLVLAVNWSAWQEVGMAVNTPPPAAAAGAGAAAWPAVDTSAPLHALLDARLPAEAVGRDQVAFATEWSAGRQWVLDEHRIMGKPTVPGTTWLEVARAAYAQHLGAGPVEIRDLLFRTPLLVPEGESAEGRIVLENDGDGHAFRILSRLPGAPNGNGAEGWQEHARGRIAALAGPEPQRHDLAALHARCSAHEMDAAGQPLKTAEAAALVSWGPRWQSMQHVSAGTGEALATLELPAEFAGDLDAFDLHPALVDVATALASAAVGKDSYLPLSYRRVRIHGRLPGRVHSYIRRTGDLASRETISCDVLLLDDEGGERVAIEGFIMKRVGQAASRFQEGAAPAAAAARAPQPPAASQQGLFAAGGMLPAEGAEVLRRLLSLRRMAQVVASPRDLAALLEQTRNQNRARLLEEADKARGRATLHPRPSLPTPYEAPSDETERALAAIWQGSLGIETVGVHDNFFDLGGDSVLGIQVVARSAEAGFPLSPEQLFEHQTIAELAAQLRARAAAEPAAAAAEPEDGAAAGLPDDLPDPGLSQLELDKVFSKLAGLGS